MKLRKNNYRNEFHPSTPCSPSNTEEKIKGELSKKKMNSHLNSKLENNNNNKNPSRHI